MYSVWHSIFVNYNSSVANMAKAQCFLVGHFWDNHWTESPATSDFTKHKVSTDIENLAHGLIQVSEYCVITLCITWHEIIYLLESFHTKMHFTSLRILTCSNFYSCNGFSLVSWHHVWCIAPISFSISWLSVYVVIFHSDLYARAFNLLLNVWYFYMEV